MSKIFHDIENIANRFEYFDDRYYKYSLPLNADIEIYKNAPKNRVFKYPDRIDCYLDSVTTIQGIENKPQLNIWRGNVGNLEANLVSAMGMTKGRHIHRALELKYGQQYEIHYLNSAELDYIPTFSNPENKDKKIFTLFTQEEMLQVARADRLIKIINPEIIGVENKCHNFKEWYAGTQDQEWVCQKGEYNINQAKEKTVIKETGNYLIDWKTGKYFDKQSTLTQLVSYAMTRDDITGVIGIDLNHNDNWGLEGVKAHILYKKDFNPYWLYFLNLLSAHYFNNENKKPYLFEIPNII